MYSAALQLWMKKRRNIANTSHDLHLMIQSVLEDEHPTDEAAETSIKRTICYLCPYKKRRMTTY
jgi:hypothetical protein